MFDKIKDTAQGGGAGDLGAYGKYLEGLSFPASKDDVVVHLRDTGADESLVAHVESLAADRFERPEDIFKGIIPR